MIPVSLIIFVISICLTCFAQDEIVIRTFLLRGLSEGNQPVPKPTAHSDEAIKLTIRSEFHNPEENVIDSIKDVIRSVYQFPYPIFLTSAYMIWDGKQENISEMVEDDWYLYPIRIWPKSISPNIINLKIEGLKFEFKEISFLYEQSHGLRVRSSESYAHLFIEPKKIEDSVAYEKWLDKELTLPFHAPVIIRLPRKDHSLFLALQAYRRDDKRMDAGLVGDRLLSYNLGGTDPVCGKKIGQGDGYTPYEKPKVHLVYEGKSYYFCSEECLNTLKKNPEKYLKKAISRIKAFPKTAINPEIDIPLRPDVLVVPGYPDAFRKDGREGTIKLEFDVDDTGRTRETRVLESAELSYEKDLQDALSQWTYPPKIQENQRVPFSRSVDLIFEAKKIQEPAAQENQPNFSAPSSGLMERIADYCGKLENAALYFICKEKIMEKLEPNRQYARVWAKIQDPFEKGAPGASMWAGASMWGGAKFGQKNSYTYDYQVIRKEGRVSERRILLEENGKAVLDNGAYPKTFRFYVNRAIYGPVGLLSRAEWPFYDYSLLKSEALNDRQAYVIEIRSKRPSSEKPVYGKAWVDKNDGSVLKMNIEADSLAGYERISADYESRGIKPLISLEIIYGFEKNGLRFPSQITLKEAYSDPEKGKIRISEMSVDYGQYKFFTVGTEIKY